MIPQPPSWGTVGEGPFASPNRDSISHMTNLPALANEDEIEARRPEGLTDKEASLTELIVLHGLSKPDAIEQAGYASQSSGYAALRRPRVMEYQQQLIREHLLESSTLAARQLRSLIETARSDYVKLEAAKDVLDRSGFKPVERHAHLHGGELSIKIDLG